MPTLAEDVGGGAESETWSAGLTTSGGGVGGLRRMFLEISSYLPVEISRGTVKWACGGAEFYGGE